MAIDSQDPEKVKVRGSNNPKNDAYSNTVQDYASFTDAGCDGIIDLGQRTSTDGVFDLGLRVC